MESTDVAQAQIRWLSRYWLILTVAIIACLIDEFVRLGTLNLAGRFTAGGSLLAWTVAWTYWREEKYQAVAAILLLGTYTLLIYVSLFSAHSLGWLTGAVLPLGILAATLLIGKRFIAIASAVTTLALTNFFVNDFFLGNVVTPGDRMTPFEYIFSLIVVGITAWLTYGTISQSTLEADSRTRLTENEYKRTLENIPIGFYRWRIEDDQVLVNPALAKLSGYREDATQMVDISDLVRDWYVVPNRRVAFKQALARDGHVVDFESEIYRYPLNERIWISESAYAVKDETGRAIFYEGTIQDITERKKATLSAVLAKERLELIANNLPAWIAYIDQGGCFQFTNDRYGLIWDISPQNLLGKNVLDVVDSETRKDIEPRMARVLQGETVVFRTTLRSRHDSRVYDGDGFYIPHWEHGKVVGYFVLVQDVTAQRKLERALNQSQKLESMGVMAGGIAHDFNNLLVAMLGQASLAKLKATKSPEKVTKHIDKVISAAERARDLTQQLLAYSGRGHFEIKDIDLNDLILENVKLLQVAITSNIRVETTLTAEPMILRGDVGQIQQVLMNLIINSAEAIPETGTITVRTSKQLITGVESDFWAHSALPLAAGEYALLEVSDTGTGMTPETIDQIFDPFFTTKESGHGLGLAAVVGIVRGHGGGLAVKSERGVGTCFQLLFPTTIVEQAVVETAVSAETTRPHGGNILVIDDQADIREVVKDVLEPVGYHIYEADGGAAGISIAQQHNGSLDLIILDLTMPGMSGGQTLKAIREFNSDIPVIISSGYSHISVSDELKSSNVSFLQKPYTAPKLVAAVAAQM